MESVVATRISSSRPRTRTMTARPSSSARPITTTGLVAPRTAARARFGLRRQVQDKTYWIGILRAKMNELTVEISKLNQESEIMSREESKIIMWKQKAETLARELKKKTLQLSIYNEYLDRIRIVNDDDLAELMEDIQASEEENRQLTSVLENKFAEKKRTEEELRDVEINLNKYQQEWQSIRKKFNDSQRQRFDKLDTINRQLTMDSDRLERQIMQLRMKKNDLESISDTNSDNLAARRQLMKALDRVRELEKQKTDLVIDSTTGGDGEEKSKLIAQVKRDNQEIAALHVQLSNIEKSRENIQSTLMAYEDLETAEKFAELKRKSLAIDAFMDTFPHDLSNEQEKLTNLRESVAESNDKYNRLIKCIELLKESDEEIDDFGGKMSMIDEKRKLQLDWNKLQVLEGKINSELELLQNRLKTLNLNIKKYSDLSELRGELEDKRRELEEERKSLNENIQRLNKEKQEISLSIDKIKKSLENNDLYKNICLLEDKLSELAAVNEDQESKLRENDNKSLKKQVFDMVNRYNQSLHGF